jgi:hypothetical protein
LATVDHFDAEIVDVDGNVEVEGRGLPFFDGKGDEADCVEVHFECRERRSGNDASSWGDGSCRGVRFPDDMPWPSIRGNAEAKKVERIVVHLCCCFELGPADIFICLGDVEEDFSCPLSKGVG